MAILAAAFLMALLVFWDDAGWTTVQAASVQQAFSSQQQTATGRLDEQNFDSGARGDLKLAGWNIQRCCSGDRTARPARYHGGPRHNRPYDRHGRLARTHFRYRKPRRSSGFRLNRPKNAANVPPRHPRRAAGPKHAMY